MFDFRDLFNAGLIDQIHTFFFFLKGGLDESSPYNNKTI